MDKRNRRLRGALATRRLALSRRGHVCGVVITRGIRPSRPGSAFDYRRFRRAAGLGRIGLAPGELVRRPASARPRDIGRRPAAKEETRRAPSDRQTDQMRVVYVYCGTWTANASQAFELGQSRCQLRAVLGRVRSPAAARLIRRSAVQLAGTHRTGRRRRRRRTDGRHALSPARCRRRRSQTAGSGGDLGHRPPPPRAAAVGAIFNRFDGAPSGKHFDK